MYNSSLRLIYYPLYTVCLQDWVYDFSFLKSDLIFPFTVNSLLLYISCNCLTTAKTCFFVEKHFGKWEEKILGDQFPFGKLQEHHPASTEMTWTFSVNFIHCMRTRFFQCWTRLLRSLLLSIFSGFNTELANFCLKSDELAWYNFIVFCQEIRDWGYHPNI